MTSLRPSCPYVLLNVSLGDRAVLERRGCRCPLGALGWSAHLHTVRSFEKLKVAGAILLTDDLVRLLEDVLPARFGGGPGDYQLVEGDAAMAEGTPGLRLLIPPGVGDVDGSAVVDVVRAFLRAAGASGEALSRSMGWMAIERRAPYLTAHGKHHPVHRLAEGDVTRSGGLPPTS